MDVRCEINDVSMMIGNTTIVCEPQVKNLGVMFDTVVSRRQHVLVNYTVLLELLGFILETTAELRESYLKNLAN